MSTLFLLLIGFLLLYYGGEILVKSSVAISLKIRVSSLVIGMTVVAFATSLPELFVSIQALFKGSSNIALGNVIGSNIANIALVLGISSLFYSFSISKQTYKIDFPVMFYSSFVEYSPHSKMTVFRTFRSEKCTPKNASGLTFDPSCEFKWSLLATLLA